MKHVSAVVYVMLISVLGCTVVFGQTQGTAQINGVVKDPTGAVLPGVEITATQTDTNTTRTTVTNETGAFVLGNLPTGPYKVEATLPGFRTFVQSGIVLGVNQNPNINVVLEVGQVTQQVEVQANVTMVETRNLGIRQVVETQEILELPLNGRNATDLIMLQGGAVATGSNSSSRALQGGVGVSVTGLADGSTTYTLDGALHTNVFDNLNLPIPFPNALQEFSIQSGSQNASGGFLGGAQIGAVTKSGTNQIHGDIFDFYRNDKFMARPYFSATKGSRTRNQAGGTIGGPLIKNKVFWFGGYQYTKNNQAPTDNAIVVPTDAMLAGDFSQFVKLYDNPVAQTGGCQGTAINSTGSGATPGLLRLTDGPNFINPARFNKAALALVHLWPRPNGMKDDTTGGSALPLTLWPDNKMQPGHSGPVGNDPCGSAWFPNNSGAHDAQIIAKVDYARNPNHTIFGRVFFTPQITEIPAYLGQKDLGFLNTGALGPNGGQDNLGSFYTIGDTYLFSPTTVNSFSIAVNRTAIHRVGPLAYDVHDVGINAYTYVPKTFEFSGLTAAGGHNAITGQGGTGTEATNVTTVLSLTNTLNMVRGAHQFSFGGSWATWKIVAVANLQSIPVFSFAPSATDLTGSTGVGIADFLLGKFNTITQSAPNGELLTQKYIGMHAQDQWKVNSKLSVNLGLRWEPFLPQQQRDGHIYNFDYNQMLKGVKSQVLLNAPAGFTYPGDPGFPNDMAGMPRNWWGFGPRAGFGWDPKGDGKMSIRASYGLSYNFINGQYLFWTNIAPPFANNSAQPRGATATLDNPWADYPGGPGFGGPGQSPFPYDRSLKNKNVGFVPNGSFIAPPKDQPTTYVQSWNFTLQRQMPKGIFVSLQYSGNGTTHAWGSYPLNPAIYVPGTGATNNGCMVPDGKGGTQSLLVAANPALTLAAARASSAQCSTTQNTNFRRILSLTQPNVGPLVSTLDNFEAGEKASYNGLVITVRKNATRNLNISGNYTWSHCINDLNLGLVGMPNVNAGNTYTSINGKEPGTPSTAFWDSNGNWLPGTTGLVASPAHREWNRANCASDRRQRINSTAVVSTPRFANSMLRKVGTGWRISSIYQWSTGSWLTVGAGSDVALIGGNLSGQTAIQSGADVYTPGKPHGPRAQYLALPVPFTVPANGVLSAVHGRNNIQGPPTWQWDGSIARTFQITERYKVEARIEAYNITNSFHAANPSTNLTGGSYGLINAAVAGSNRDLQFALKAIF